MIRIGNVKHKPKKRLLDRNEQDQARRAFLLAGHSHRSAAVEIGIHQSLLSQIVYGRRSCSAEIREKIMNIHPRADIPKKSYLTRAQQEFQQQKGHK